MIESDKGFINGKKKKAEQTTKRYNSSLMPDW